MAARLRDPGVSTQLALLCLAQLAQPTDSLHLTAAPPRITTMRGRRCAACAANADDSGVGAAFKKFFSTNRDDPEAVANQERWGREMMDAEVPDATLEGMSIADREDFIVQYVASEKEKFGREIDRATAEAEVDEWLLRQATVGSAVGTSGSDLAVAAAVFVGTFGVGLWFANQ